MLFRLWLRAVARALRLPVDAPPPRRLGVQAGALARCPRSPNCVSSQADDPVHAIEPFRELGDRDTAFACLRTVLASEPGARIAEERPGYLHAEFTTRIWRFVDDVEFLWDEERRIVDVRSASRVGRRDYGANRRRVERLRARLAR
jgi:uncharacterized protein (DUF1499 family)